MKRINLFFVVIIAMLSTIFILLAGCAKKELVSESSEQPQNEMKQEAAKPNVPVTEEKAVQPASESGQKIAATAELKDIHFDFDKYNLRPEDRAILSTHADWLLKNADYKVKIEGNCDERGTEEYNMALGQRRADEAKEYLLNMGIAKKRISTISYGKDRPLDPGHDEEAWAKNRRDDFVLSK